MGKPVSGVSGVAGVPGVSGTNTAGGVGVLGSSDTYQGVSGTSRSNAGVAGESQHFHAIYGVSHDVNNAGVIGINEGGGWGVVGRSSRVGVSGESTSGDGVSGSGHRGVVGTSDGFQGVYGFSRLNAGVAAESQRFHALYAVSHDPNNAGVFGVNQGGGWGVVGRSDTNTGVSGESVSGVGLHGKSVSGLAARFEGAVQIAGNLTMTHGGDIFLQGADCAEEFAISTLQDVEPGSVMVIDDDGSLHPCSRPYDRRVAGVVSGAGGYRPGVILDAQPNKMHRRAIALVGKVYCRVDADFGAIAVGELLTTSSSPGHAMKAGDPRPAIGTLLGKALQPLARGRGLIAVLVALQ
jgi:hypothetical protein